MSVASHRHYISTTADDLERAAGTLEIKAKSELNTAKDFWAVFQAEAFISNQEQPNETEE